MTLATSLVEVRTITSEQPRSNFDVQKIEAAAQLIVAAEGIIKPIILNRTGINSFEVVDGHFEYYAAARAREINLEIGEVIAAYIMEEDNEKVIKEQIELFRSPAIITDNPPNVQTNNLETRLTNIELRLENRLNELKREYTQTNKKLEQEISQLKNSLPEKIEPLTTFNEASLIELSRKLKSVLHSDKKVNAIAPQIMQARPFKSLTEVLENVTGLGEKTMLKIIDRWLYS